MSLTFLSRTVLIHLEAYGGVIQLSEIKKYLLLCSEDERNSYRVGTT